MKSLYLLVALSFLLCAQTSTTQLGGTVTDSSGATVPAATVVATNESTGLRYTQATTQAGLYAFPSIPAGSYTLSVESKGFKKFQLTKIVLQINTPVTVNATLELGAATETSRRTQSLRTESACGRASPGRGSRHEVAERAAA